MIEQKLKIGQVTINGGGGGGGEKTLSPFRVMNDVKKGDYIHPFLIKCPAVSQADAILKGQYILKNVSGNIKSYNITENILSNETTITPAISSSSSLKLFNDNIAVEYDGSNYRFFILNDDNTFYISNKLSKNGSDYQIKKVSNFEKYIIYAIYCSKYYNSSTDFAEALIYYYNKETKENTLLSSMSANLYNDNYYTGSSYNYIFIPELDKIYSGIKFYQRPSYGSSPYQYMYRIKIRNLKTGETTEKSVTSFSKISEPPFPDTYSLVSNKFANISNSSIYGNKVFDNIDISTCTAEQLASATKTEIKEINEDTYEFKKNYIREESASIGVDILFNNVFITSAGPQNTIYQQSGNYFNNQLYSSRTWCFVNFYNKIPESFKSDIISIDPRTDSYVYFVADRDYKAGDFIYI